MGEQLQKLFKNTNPTLKVVYHDRSHTGLKYKMRVELPIRVKKADLGWVVLDISNALYRNKDFPYALHPSVEIEGKKTILYYFFNDTREAVKQGFKLEPHMQAAYVKQEIDPNNRNTYSAYQPPYLRDRTQYE